MNENTVTYELPVVVSMKPNWTLLRDCIEGETVIKSKRETYLPKPNPEDKSKENNTRFDSYLQRAVFYNVTSRTLRGFKGQVFSQDPTVTLPSSLEVLKVDADGGGTGLIQQSRVALEYVLAFGRCGILTDYPATETATSRSDIVSGAVHATLTLYRPENIINWRTVVRDGKKKLSLVVLVESEVVDDDGFAPTTNTAYRVLRLVDNTYTVEMYRKVEESFIGQGQIVPKDGSGRSFDTIPFVFTGSDDNCPEPNDPPLYDLAALNVAHYRNSADYEEACYMLGQPTPYFAGLTQQWVSEVLKGRVVLGSRSAVPLPAGASAGLLQVAPNTMPKEAMEAKERQMVALGARLVQQDGVQRTATEAGQERSAEVSTLVSSAKNVSAAYTQALTWAAQFHGESSVPEFKLNERFAMTQLPATERAQLVADWQAGAIGFEELRSEYKSAGIAYLKDDEVKAEKEANALLDPMANTGAAGKNPANAK